MTAVHSEKLSHDEKILKAFRSSESITVPQLSRDTGIGLTTIKKYVAAGLKNGSVAAGDTAESTGGRKPQLFKLNAGYRYYFVFVIDNDDLHLEVFDYCFRTAEHIVLKFKLPDYLKTVEAAFEAALEKYSAVGAVCFSLPCVVSSGVIVDWYYNPSLNGFDFKSYFENKYRVRAAVENDMKLTALAKTAVSEFSESTIATVQFGHNGIGAAAAVNGSILSGYNGFAGEIGYIIDKDKDVTSIAYTAKIVNALIVFINPEKIFFYNSDNPNSFSDIFNEAVKGIPGYAIPGFSVTNDYLTDVTSGLLESIYKYEYFDEGDKQHG